MIQFRLLSLTHKTTEIGKREHFALNTEEVLEVLHLIKSLSPTEESLVLSTCNRTEILYVAENDQKQQILELICKIKHQELELAINSFRHLTDEQEVLNYFFRVSSGLESQILGDAQIISQIKTAYQFAQKQKTAGTYIHRLMHVVFSANKKIASQTGFRSGISSAPYAAVDMISEYQKMLKDPKIAIIGFGDMGQNVTRHLLSRGNQQLTVFNRTENKISLFNRKNKTQITYRSLEQLDSLIESYDIIISTPSVQNPLISAGHFSSPIHTFKVLVDISMPRSISPIVTDLPGITLFDMDDIGQVTQQTIEQKLACISDVESILLQHMDEFFHWKQDNKNLEVIRSMKTALHSIKMEEIDRFQKQGQPNVDVDYDKIMDAMIQKIIKKAVVNIKSLQNEEERQLYNSMITQTFL
ncbi:glutamyl-tRNA reductase [Echinicola sp. CAU 1574]|uniref:Glutamyl-tRNA reductase n=1 Tax=Echinicola arenosa TaxID=2774144 RepID=A0ABR9AGU2_9BACT|nr:glutamyl-tRNA reductase [Echinicola arenosa]MBD8487476.1 glutamyl-tRNA reductase [Echinicola arenosa]